MKINEYFLRNGTDGLRKLAEKAGTKTSYLLQLRYVTSKRPSLDMAQRLVAASAELANENPELGVLTMDGLANPEKVLVRDSRVRL